MPFDSSTIPRLRLTASKSDGSAYTLVKVSSLPSFGSGSVSKTTSAPTNSTWPHFLQRMR
jgi:hypothetical protein